MDQGIKFLPTATIHLDLAGSVLELKKLQPRKMGSSNAATSNECDMKAIVKVLIFLGVTTFK